MVPKTNKRRDKQNKKQSYRCYNQSRLVKTQTSCFLVKKKRRTQKQFARRGKIKDGRNVRNRFAILTNNFIDVQHRFLSEQKHKAKFYGEEAQISGVRDETWRRKETRDRRRILRRSAIGEEAVWLRATVKGRRHHKNRMSCSISSLLFLCLSFLFFFPLPFAFVSYHRC